MNAIDNLLKMTFSSRNLQEKLTIEELGRPLPDVNIKEKSNGNGNLEYTKQFHRQIFDCYWICGHDIRNSLFCFPCLVFLQLTTDSASHALKTLVILILLLNSIVKLRES